MDSGLPAETCYTEDNSKEYFKGGIYKEGMDMSALKKIDGISTTYREFYEGLDHDVLICRSSDSYEDEEWYTMDFTHGVKYLGSTDWRCGGMLQRGANPM